MTETVYTHKHAAVRKPVRPVCFMRAPWMGARVFQHLVSGAVRTPQAVSYAVDTHELQTRCTLESVLSIVVGHGVHAYPQTLSVLQMSVSPLAPCTSVYTHKPARQLAGQQGLELRDGCGLLAWSADTVYTHKQMAAPRVQRPAPRRGHRRPTQCVYTHKHPTEPRLERGSVRLGHQNGRTTMT